LSTQKNKKTGKGKTSQNEDREINLGIRQFILKEGLVIFLVLISCYLLLALSTFDAHDPGWTYTGKGESISNSAGRAGAWLADVFFSLIGYMAFIFPLLLLLQAYRTFRKELSLSEPNYILLSTRFFSWFFVFVCACGLLAIHFLGKNSMPSGSGGILGMEVARFSVSSFNVLGASLILFALLLVFISFAGNISWFIVAEKIGAFSIFLYERGKLLIDRKRRQQQEKKDILEKQKAREKIFEVGQQSIAKKKAPTIAAPKPQVKESKRVQKEKQKSLFTSIPSGELPEFTLLDEKLDSERRGYSSEALEGMSRLLEIKLKDFGIDAEVTEVQPGPVVTRFEIQPAAGVKVSRITNLAKDIARSLAVISVRVVEVIPGKTVVGIEIPNEHREMIKFSEIVSTSVFEDSKSHATLALGKDISGLPVVADLAKMPHLLVAGTTGSGKSVGVNAMLLSMLFKSNPEDLRLILIDPKMLELAVYDGIPHLLTPVVTDMKDAANALRWSVAEMERRYKLMANVGVRNLGGFNKKVGDAIEAGEPLKDPLWVNDGFDEDAVAPDLEKLPIIVVVIDEFADMMMIVGKKVEELIARIAQKARAAGIHLILATQRPSVDVITGLIKANVPARIGFQVSSKVDSRTILDQGGAEQLLGHGDMLFLPPGTSLPERVHGAFVSDDEVHRVCDDWRRRGEPDYLEEVLEGGQANSGEVGMLKGLEEDSDDPESDALYDQAVSFVVETRRVSISSVQRKFRIGYNRAARLVEAMEMAGVVSEMQSNGSREVLAPSLNHE
jgi:S-DNA-T family DNA segregation ATPase FtsK/SpoIIIE